MFLQIRVLVWGMGQALLRSPKGRNAPRNGIVKLGWVHCLQYTVNCFQYNVCDLGRYESSNQSFSSLLLITNDERSCIRNVDDEP